MGFEQLQARLELPVGPLLCVINGTTRGRHWSSAAARAELRRTAAAAGVRAGSRDTSSAMLTQSRWLTKASR